MRTADQIEAQNSQTELEQKSGSEQSQEQPRNPADHLRRFRWGKGQSGNPGGRPKKDFAAEFARKVLEANGDEELLNEYAEGFVKQLRKGNAYTFKELAERGYGKLVEKHETKHFYEETPDADLNKRIADLERDLGYAREIDEAGRIGISQAGAVKTNGEAKDSHILS